MNSKYAILIVGLPGTGKTAIAKRILNKLDCFYCSIDIIHSKLFSDAEMELDRDYTNKELDILYNAAQYIVEIESQSDRNILLDGVFRSKRVRDEISDKLNNQGYLLFKYYIVCDEKRAVERVRKRKERGSFSPAGVQGYEEIRSKFEEPDDSEKFYKISNTGSLEEIVAFLYEQIKYKICERSN